MCTSMECTRQGSISDLQRVSSPRVVVWGPQYSEDECSDIIGETSSASFLTVQIRLID